jgi:cytoskeletal protein RodZ
MRMKWLFRFLILFGIVLVGFCGYLLTRRTGAFSIDSPPISAPNESHGAKAFTAGTDKAETSQPGSESPKEHPAESSVEAKASQDFSGVTTIDPGSPLTSSVPQKTSEQKKVSTSPLPLVFQTVDPQAFKISPEQQEILDRLQQNFLDEIGGANQDPNDPQYLARWKEAQPLINEQLQAQLGQDFFLKYESTTGRREAKNK